jgi:hypothetical protein
VLADPLVEKKKRFFFRISPYTSTPLKETEFLVFLSCSNLPMDPLAPSITFFDKEGKGRVNYIGNLVPEKVFYPTPGLWFSNQSDEVCRFYS